MDGFVDVYAKTTGVKHRVPAHFMDHPTLSKPFRKTPKTRAAEGESIESATPVTDVVTSDASTNTDTPAAGD